MPLFLRQPNKPMPSDERIGRRLSLREPNMFLVVA
jgi:hypothetical protein